jgi:hypothetical protein
MEDATRRRPPVRWALRALLFAAALFLVTELVCRVLYPRRAPIRFEQDVEVLLGVGQDRFGAVLEPDEELFWRLAPDVELSEGPGRYSGRISNHQRLREDHEIAVPRPAGERRVLFLGSSPTFCTGVRLEECFVELAEQELELAFGEEVECVNAGVPGYSLFQGWRFLDSEGHRYEPDLIVVQFGASGIQVWDDKSDIEHYQERQRSTPPPLLRHARIFQLLWQKLHRQEPRDEPHPRLSPREFRSLLVELKRYANQRRVGLMFLIWPARTFVLETEGPRRTPLHELMARFGENHGIPVVDLLPLLEELCSRHPLEEVYLDLWHVTPLANRVIATRVAEEIRRWYATPEPPAGGRKAARSAHQE